MEYYSALKMSEILPFAATRMDQEILIVTDVSQTKNDINELTYKVEIELQIWKINLQLPERKGRGDQEG